MNQNDKHDEYICKTLLGIVSSVRSFYKYKTADLFAKRQVGILSEDEYIKELKKGEYMEETKKYYNSLCTEKLELLGFTSNSYSFSKIFSFSDKILNEMLNVKYNELKPYIEKYLLPLSDYNVVKEKLKEENKLIIDRECEEPIV